jgi:hypothetical protein
MGIDRIGGPSRGTIGRPVSSTEQPTGTHFKPVLRAEATSPATCSEPLARLRSGEVGPAGYVELHVQAATAHLSLPGSALEDVQQQLLDRCEADPLLLDLVARATSAGTC